MTASEPVPATPAERIKAAERKLRLRGIPVYRDENPGLLPGLYLSLFHGFASEEDREVVDDWGGNGPMIGPLRFVHTTYGSCVKFEFLAVERANLYFPENRHGVVFDPKRYVDVHYGLAEELEVNKNGTIEYDGFEYGDWTVHVVT